MYYVLYYHISKNLNCILEMNVWQLKFIKYLSICKNCIFSVCVFVSVFVCLNMALITLAAH